MSSGYGDPETRLKILDAARVLAETMGPSMRVADIAERAGVSRQAVYLHFGDRKGLVLALLSHLQEVYAVHEMVASLEETDSPLERMRGVIEVLTTLNGHVDQVGWLFEEAQHLDEAFGRDWRNRARGTRDWIRAQVEMVSDHLAAGWDVESAADFVYSVTSLGAWRDLTRDLGWTRDEYVASTFRWVRSVVT